MNYKKYFDYLKKYNQEQLLTFYNEISSLDKRKLINKIKLLDFKKINKTYIDSYKNNFDINDKFSPLETIIKKNLSIKELDYYKNIGENILKNNEYAIVTMAGGSGSRLGHNGPKGTYKIKINNKNISLFQILLEKIQKVNKLYNIVIDWYIMTGNSNYEPTIEYFKCNDYFGYPKNKIHFFVQDKIPILSVDGKILLENKSTILEASNGNGNVFKSLDKNGYLKEMKKNKIKYIFFNGIDNILVKVADPVLIGLMYDKKYTLSSKTIFKKDPLSKDYVFCKRNDKPSMITYEEITEDFSNLKDKFGNYLYRGINILYHVISLDEVINYSKKELRYNRAYKKYNYLGLDGKYVIAQSNNSFKFEQFIFDAFSYSKDMLLFQVEKDEEFAPIKNKEGINSPETAIELYIKSQKKED